MKVNNNMHNTREVSRTLHSPEREAPPTPKHGLPSTGKKAQGITTTFEQRVR